MRRQINKQRNCSYNELEDKSSGTTHVQFMRCYHEPTHSLLLLFSRSVVSDSL